MIVKMKKLLLLALKSDRDSALQKLRDLGVVEVTSENLVDSADRLDSMALLNTLDRMNEALSSRKVKTPATAEVPAALDDLQNFALEAFAEEEKLAKALEALRREASNIEPWGEYDPELLNDLRKNNIFVYLCESSEDQYNSFAEELSEKATLVKLSFQQGICRWAVIAFAELDDVNLPTVKPAARKQSAVLQDIAEVEAQQKVLEDKFDALSGRLDDLKVIRGKLASNIDLLSARDGLSDCGEIIALRGFLPASDANKVEEAAKANAWAVVLSDPDPEDAVPVLLEPPRWVKPILPLFDFLGISPGYDEFDMSPGMLIFFSIFFSMIINDGGYALIMLAASIAAAVLLRKNRKAVMPCRLALVLSGCAAAWGICNGAYFGTETSILQLKFLASGANQTAHLQLICFVLAFVHLSLGHCWKMVNSNGVMEKIGQLGWVPILLLDFMVVLSILVFPGMALPKWVLITGGVGFAMVLVCGVNWRDVVAICNFPFDLIASFTDTLSYVRLFAVGMSGTYMAQSFNNMGMDIFSASPWLLPVAILVIVFGHALNAALAFMSVLVHGVRLNTLEFSNHAGIRWGGQAFKPLKNFER